MSESVIADFVGKFNADLTPHGEPVAGRIVCSQRRLVLAADSEQRVQIPLSAIFDIGVGHVPPELGDFFDSTVTIAFEHDEEPFVAAVEADDDYIDKFATVLFKAILNGTAIRLQHPARRGGRVTDEPFVAADLALEPGTVVFRHEDGPVSIELASVTGFDRDLRVVGGRERPVLVVRHVQHGESLTTLAATQSNRKLALLGRYLRTEYSELLSGLQDVELTDEKTELLVALYSGAGGQGVSLAGVLDLADAEVARLREQLVADELITDGEDGPALTAKGRVVVANHFDADG